MSDNENKSVSSGGIGFVGVFQIVFIVLKLCGVINWAWWIVLAPLWGSVALAVIMIAVILILVSIKNSKLK